MSIRTSGTGSQQYYFIELINYWQGRIEVSDVEMQFGISRQAASKHINTYEKLFQDETNKNPFHKIGNTNQRQAAADFEPLFISRHVDQYLTWLTSGGLDLPNMQSEGIQVNQLPLPTRNISPKIIRPLVQAINEGRRVDVEYLSLSTPVNQGRVIAPHSFVKTNLRWHVRGYDQEKQRFADFNLSRFRDEPFVLDKSDNTIQDDAAWNTFITLILRPDSRLSKEKQAILQQDYSMEDGELHISTRACLATYVLQELRVSAKFVDVMPEAQQLELVNMAELKAKGVLFDV